jgi:uncharacterized protein YcbX
VLSKAGAGAGRQMNGMVTGLFRYPVKGLSAEPLQCVSVAAGGAFPYDRAWAIENGPSRFDPADPKPVPDISFLILMRDERLAGLEARFDAGTECLTLLRGGRQVASGILSVPSGRQILEQFIAAYMADSLRGRPKIVGVPGYTITEGGVPAVHIVSLPALRDLERLVGRPVDPLRFRPNIVMDGPEPWSELGWVGRELSLGSVRLKVIERTSRCAATNVDPATGARDMDIPAVLRRALGHIDFGVYAVVESGGQLAIGDQITLHD